jgi:LmbE family N-acetylglucosaminyl deacetylase
MKVLALSVHPDDETLGCGGTLLAHGDAGDELHWLILTQPHGPRWTDDVIAQKRAEVDRVAEAYRMRDVTRLGLPTGQLDALPTSELMDAIGAVISAVAPDVVYTVHGGDVHTDHAAAFTALLSVLKPFHMARLGMRRVLAYETLSSTEAAARLTFAPNVFTDVSATIERKLEIMELYATEVQATPLPRSSSSIRALASVRGAAIGVEYAEAFVLVRELIR